MMDDLIAYAWEYLACAYNRDIQALIEVEDKQEENCRTGFCGLPMGEDRKRLHLKAVHALKKATEWGRETPSLYYSLYWNYHYLDQFVEGAEACRRALSLQPDHTSAAHGLGICLKSLGQFSEAITVLKHSLELNSNQTSVIELLMECYSIQGQYEEEVIRLTEEALERFPNHVPFLRARFQQISKAGRHEEARVLAERAAALQPRDYAPQVALGHAYSILDQTAEAVQAFSAALSLAPGNHYALEPLLDLLQKLGRSSEIPDLLEAQASQYSDDPVNGAFLGKALYRYGCYESAIRVLSLNHHWLPSFVYLARSHRALGRSEEALQVLEIAVTSALQSISNLDAILPELKFLDIARDQPDLALSDTFETTIYDQAIQVFLEAGAIDQARTHLPRYQQLDGERATLFADKLKELEAQTP